VIPAIVDAAFVAALVTDRPDAVLADVRWYLDGRDGRTAYEAAHLPAAVWVDLDQQLAAHDRPVTEGRHPLPSPSAFAEAMGELGIGDDTLVIAYDDTGGLTAGRLVVMLRMLGHDAAILDGGIGNWIGPVHSGWVDPTPTTFTARPWPAERLATADEVGAAAARGDAVLDARAGERFTGAVTHVDPRPGHIPGARNAPWSDVLDTSGRLKSAAALREHYEALGVAADSDVIAYCGSGVSACLNIVALERAGFAPARLYVASWSGWCADPDRPAALGE
jgi:thiosulfate/3-mercaptopyruvate sulfurtransferase